jgi:hypothetical protein
VAKGKYEKWLTTEGLLQLEAWARNGLTDEQIAKNMGVSVATLYNYKKVHLEILESLKKGKEVVDIQVENALLKRALGYEYVEVTEERIVDSGQVKRHGGQSELTEKEWQFAIKYFNNQCCYCGTELTESTKDHIIPLAKGGQLTASNIVPCCRQCNSSKKDNNLDDWYTSQPFFDKYRKNKIEDYITLIALMESDSQINGKDDKLVITKQVTKHVSPETTAGIFWLKNRKPEIWRDRKDIDLNANVNNLNPYAGLTTEELKKLIDSG